MLNTINTNNAFNNMTEHFTINALSGVNNEQNSTIPSIKVSDAKNPKRKQKIWNIITATMGTSILAAGALVFILNKGFSYTSYNRLNKVIERLNESIEKSAIGKKSKSLTDKISIFLLKGIRNGLDVLKSSANFSAVKDSGFDKLARKFKFMHKPLDALTNLFKKISTNAVDQSYHKVLLQIDEGLCPDISKFLGKIRADRSVDLDKIVTIKEVSKPLREWLQELDAHQSNISGRFSRGFSKAARDVRAQERDAALEGLDTRVQDTIWGKDGVIRKFKKNKGKLRTYITETYSQEGKIELRNKIMADKKALTNNIGDNYATVKAGMSEIRQNLQIDDEDASILLRRISGKMEAYRGLGGELENRARNNLVNEISQMFTQFQTQIRSTGRYNEETQAFISKQIEYICSDILTQSQKGELERAVTIIHGLKKQGIMDAATESTLLKRAKTITKDLHKATTMEADELYNKFAEFKVGSVPPDVLSLLFPLGVGVAAVSSANSKDEKISRVLTTGVPLIGSLVTMLIGTAKMFSASKNIIFGVTTGALLNLAGKIADKGYKDYAEKKSFTQIAIDAYKKNPLFYNETKNVKK